MAATSQCIVAFLDGTMRLAGQTEARTEANRFKNARSGRFPYDGVALRGTSSFVLSDIVVVRPRPPSLPSLDR